MAASHGSGPVLVVGPAGRRQFEDGGHVAGGAEVASAGGFLSRP